MGLLADARCVALRLPVDDNVINFLGIHQAVRYRCGVLSRAMVKQLQKHLTRLVVWRVLQDLQAELAASPRRRWTASCADAEVDIARARSGVATASGSDNRISRMKDHQTVRDSEVGCPGCTAPCIGGGSAT